LVSNYHSISKSLQTTLNFFKSQQNFSSINKNHITSAAFFNNEFNNILSEINNKKIMLSSNFINSLANSNMRSLFSKLSSEYKSENLNLLAFSGPGRKISPCKALKVAAKSK